MKVTWLIEQCVILVDVGTKITLDEMIRLNQALLNRLHEAESPVHVVTLCDAVETYPKNISKLAQTFTYLHHANLGWNILITSNRTLRFITKVISRTLGLKQIRLATNYQEAIELLAHWDSSLADLPTSVD